MKNMYKYSCEHPLDSDTGHWELVNNKASCWRSRLNLFRYTFVPDGNTEEQDRGIKAIMRRLCGSKTVVHILWNARAALSNEIKQRAERVLSVGGSRANAVLCENDGIYRLSEPLSPSHAIWRSDPWSPIPLLPGALWYVQISPISSMGGVKLLKEEWEESFRMRCLCMSADMITQLASDDGMFYVCRTTSESLSIVVVSDSPVNIIDELKDECENVKDVLLT
jgi:hypothetical protein